MTDAETITRELIAELAGGEPNLDRATVLADLPNVDSLSKVELVFALEERFDIEIGDGELEERFKTVGNVLDLVAEKIAGRGD
jgi:acyl carrier protein